MSDPLNSTEADGGLASAGAVDWPKPDWQEQKSALKWPLIVLFGIPLVILACGLLLMVISYRLAQKPASPAKPAPAVAAAPVQPVDKDAQIAQLQSQIVTLQGQLAHPTDPATPAQPLYAADPTALSQLSVRLDRVEANQRALAKAAASAFAARTLQLAAKTQQPFLSELAVVEAGLDDPSLASSLRPYAEKGVPSEVTLAVAFPAAAAKANIAAKSDGENNSLSQKIGHALGGFISIRRTDNPTGQGPEAILQRAEIRLNGGDLKGAVAYLNTLPPAAQKALGPWLAQARARVLVDDTTRRISETALNRLSQMTSDPLTGGGAL